MVERLILVVLFPYESGNLAGAISLGGKGTRTCRPHDGYSSLAVRATCPMKHSIDRMNASQGGCGMKLSRCPNSANASPQMIRATGS